MGGYFPTFHYPAILKEWNIDSVVLGEGDLTIVQLARSVLRNQEDWKNIPGLAYNSKGKIIANNRPRLTPLEILPHPARDNLSQVKEQYESFGAIVTTSRGCPYSCSFCQISKFYQEGGKPTRRVRKLEDVADELSELKQEFAPDWFFFGDDVFIGPRREDKKYARQLAKLITEAGIGIPFYFMTRVETVERTLFSELKEAGLFRVQLGVESFVDSQLRRYRKSTTRRKNLEAIQTLKSLGITPEIFYDTF